MTTVDDILAALPAPAAVPEGGEERPGLLPAEFYAARPVFAHIKQAAHSRGRPADVLFYSTLARLSGMISPNIAIVTGISGRGSMNVFAAAVGPSGSGKSTGQSGARELILPMDPEFRDGLPVGTGEGIAEMFMGTVDEPTGEIHQRGPYKGDPVTRKVRKQVRHNGYIYIDEGQTMATLAMRQGSTLAETLRRAAVGEALGQTNASEERTRYVAPGSYSLGLFVGFQPSTAVPLLNDASTGTPQRFFWCWALDPTIPDTPPEWPGPIAKHPGQIQTADPIDVLFPERIRKMLWAEKTARNRGELEVAELDGHAGLMKAKAAGLFALMEGRYEVTEDDWTLAETVWASSCAVRDSLVERARREVEAQRQATEDAKVSVEVRAHMAKNEADRTLERLVRLVVRHSSQPGGITFGYMRRALESKDRPHLPAAVDLAEERGLVIVEDNTISRKTD
ncbi:hypothetical protein [Streptomyces flaveus]|uniref:Uncharacterized protein n=1 Tax=Streptomyces flaveus TaxID=66370 RepID=A0A917QRT7_9ACTN|nr:hypothetical protein [Streptomyces flaveus]GGK65448.1 hypothetical protein GCM10010094_28110 [Streptomyces flaveus]